MLLLLSIPSVSACGGMMPAVGQVVASDAQQAVFRIDPGAVSVEYRVRYEGSAQDFAWVIPVPGHITDVAEGDTTTFTTLEEQTAPLVWNPEPSESGGCGCLASKNGLDGTRGGIGSGVTITGHGFAGDYAYVTLQADDAGALATWLDDNGYDGTLAASDIAAYVADPVGYEWVAVQVRPEAAQLDEGVVFTPLRIAWGPAADGALHASFPARMARSSTATSDRIELYVFADSLVDLGGGWTAIPANGIEVGSEEEAAAGYEAELERVGTDKRAFVWAWSGTLTDPLTGVARFLTRYDTIVTPSTQTTDPVFTETGLQWSQEVDITVYDESGGEGAAGLFVGIGALGSWIRRRSGPTRRTGPSASRSSRARTP